MTVSQNKILKKSKLFAAPSGLGFDSCYRSLLPGLKHLQDDSAGYAVSHGRWLGFLPGVEMSATF